MNIIDGKKLAERLRSEMAAEASEMKKHGTEVTLAVVLVGDDPASAVYVRNKERACEKVGIRSLAFKLGSSTTQEELNTLVRELNGREDVHGILVQFPLPSHLSQTEVLSLIDPQGRRRTYIAKSRRAYGRRERTRELHASGNNRADKEHRDADCREARGRPRQEQAGGEARGAAASR